MTDDPAPAEESTVAIRNERSRIFLANRWGAPVGTLAAVSLYTAVVANAGFSPRRLAWWVVAMSVVFATQIAAVTVPRSLRWTNREGLPKLARWIQIGAGIGYGSLLWLDPELSRTSEFRWITLAMIFAVSAGAMTGITGVNSLAKDLLLPMCLGSAAGLVAAGQPLLALSVAIFTAIAVRSLHENDKVWVELIELRIHSSRVAEEHVWAATHDQLTMLLNRAGVMQQLADHAERRGHPITLMFIDLDHFKEVNDRFGHAGGDLVLIEAAERLCDSVRGGDVVGRLGGDEFVVLLDGAYDKATSTRLANRIIDDLEQPMSSTTSDDIYISASVGIAPSHRCRPHRSDSYSMPTTRCIERRRRVGARSSTSTMNCGTSCTSEVASRPSSVERSGKARSTRTPNRCSRSKPVGSEPWSSWLGGGCPAEPRSLPRCSSLSPRRSASSAI